MKPIFMKINDGHYINLSLVTEIVDNEVEDGEHETTIYFGEGSSMFTEPSFAEIMEMVSKTIAIKGS